MQQYLLSVYQPDGDPPPPGELEAITSRVLAWESELKDAGSWVFTAGLREVSAATVLRARGQRVLVTDGPFTEGKEHLGGFTVISVASAAAAREWAGRLAAASGLPVEVRQLR